MKEHARGLVIGSIVLMLALPVLYVGSEGPWYLATGERHFAAGTAYRAIYRPLDALGDRVPAMDEARQLFANGWLRLSGNPRRRAHIREAPEEMISIDVEMLWDE